MKFTQTFLILALLITSPSLHAKSFYGLFGDIKVENSSNQSLNSDSISGALDFYLAHEFTDKFSGLIEFSTIQSANHSGSHAERYSLQYSFTQKFNLAVGRFHTPLGRINRSEHHGSLLRTAVSRPFFLEYHETTSTMPLHIVGFMSEGSFHRNNMNIGYEASIHSDQNIVSETHEQPQIEPNDYLSGPIDPGYSLRIHAFPNKNNWQIGAFFYQNNTEFDLHNTNTPLEEIITGLDMRYIAEQWELSAEIFSFTHDYHNSNKENKATAYFTELGYNYSKRIKLIYRYAAMNIDEADDYYQAFNMNDQNRHTMALNYSLNDHQAFKLELEHLNHDDNSIEDMTFIKAQWSFLFH